MSDKSPTRHRWFRFSLRTLFVVALLIGFGCAWVGMQLQQKRRHEAVVNEIMKMGGSTYFEAGEVPAWKEWLFGSNAVKPVVLSLDQTDATDSLLSQTRGMNLFWLGLRSTEVSDAGLINLKGLTSLERLDLSNTQVTDAGLTHLKRLASLSNLYLDNTQVTDAGLTHLKGLTSLEYLDVSSTQVTQAGVDRLQEALPSCEIVY